MKVAGTDLRVLRVFDAVVRHGGFAAAQAELNINQSTISNHITALEERLGVKLCQRGRSGFRLTEKGEIVVEAIERLLLSLDEFSSDVGTLKGHLVGELRLGLVDCIATDANSKLPEAIALFKSQPNDVTIQAVQESPQTLQEKVLEGPIHIGVGSFPHKISGLEYEPLYTEKHSLYCGESHPLFAAQDASIDTRSLKEEEMVGRGYWRDGHLKDMGFDNVPAVAYQIEPQLILILSGKYLGFLPDHYAETWVRGGKLRRLAASAISYTCTFDIIVRRGYRKTQVIEAFLQALRSTYRSQH